MIYIYLIFAALISYAYYKKTAVNLSLRQKYFLSSLRFVSLFLVGMLIINPILKWSFTEQKKQNLLILKDVSESMDKEINGKLKSKIAEETAKRIIAEYGHDFELIHQNFADGINGNTNSTNLSKTLKQLKKEVDFKNIKQIVVLSDGWLKDTEFDSIVDLGIPITTIQHLIQANENDVKISNVEFKKSSYQNQITPFRVYLKSNFNQIKGKLNFYIDEKKVSFKKININKSSTVIELEHEFTDSGLFPFKCEFIDETDETNTENNIFLNAINIQKQKKNIVIIADELSWDLKFISDALSIDDRFEYQFILIKKNEYFIKNEKVNLEDFIDANLDLLIVINNQIKFKENSAISEYLKNKGNLWFIGKGINKFAGSLVYQPSINQSFKDALDINELGTQYETLRLLDNKLETLPPVTFFVSQKKNSSSVLAQSKEDKIPLILFSEVNNSKILHFNFTSFWKWKSVLDSGTFNSFISNISEWLTTKNNRNYYAYTNKNQYFQGENIRLFLEPYDEKHNLLIDSNNLLNISLVKSDSTVIKEFMKLDDNIFVSSFDNLLPGQYQFKIMENSYNLNTSGKFIVHDSSYEKFDFGYNNSLLKYISKITNGKNLSADNINKIENTKSAKITRKKYIEFEIYKKWWLLTIFLITFCSELFFRKRWSLV